MCTLSVDLTKRHYHFLVAFLPALYIDVHTNVGLAPCDLELNTPYFCSPGRRPLAGLDLQSARFPLLTNLNHNVNNVSTPGATFRAADLRHRMLAGYFRRPSQ